MIVGHLIGGNEILGIDEGVVIVNGVELDYNYSELVQILGNVSLGDLNTNVDIKRHESYLINDYLELIQEVDSTLDESFVIDNKLTSEVCYSYYQLDLNENTLKLYIDTY